MPWLVPSLIATMTGAIILLFCYSYLYTQDKQKYLKIWAVSWGIYFTRYIFLLAMLLWQKNGWLLIGKQLSTLVSGVLLLYGSYLFINKKFPRILILVSLLSILWVFYSILTKLPFLYMALPTFTFMAVIYIWTGLVYLNYSKSEQKEASVVGVAFILWGLHKGNYPFLRPIAWFAPWGYLIAAVFEFVTALGLIIVYFSKTKDKLIDNQDKLHNFIKKSPLPIVITDNNQNIKFYNDKFIDTFGYTLDDISTAEQWWEKIYPDPDYRIKIQDSWYSAIEEAKLQNTDIGMQEWEMTIKDGSKKVCEFYMMQTVDGGFIVMNDITERKQFEESIRRNVERHRTILKTAMDGFWLVDNVGRFLEVNETYCKMSGYAEHELLCMNISDVEDVEMAADTAARIQTILSEGQGQFESRHRRKDGSVFDVEVSVQYRPSDEPKLVVFIRDITERRQAEDSVRKSLGRMRTMFNEAPLGIALINSLTGQIYEVNPRYGEIVGRPLEEMASVDWMSITHPDDVQKDLDNIALLNAGEITGFNVEKRYIKPDESAIWVNVTVTPVKVDDQTQPKHLAMIEDITSRKQAEVEKKKLETQLRQAQKMETIGSLASGIAHDFNNMLFPIIGMSEMLLEDLPKDSLEYENASQIFQSGKRAGDLVQQILAFSRQGEHKMTPVRVQNVLKEVLKLTRSSIPSNIEVHQNIQQNCGLVMADETQIHQVAMNLITNAYHAVEYKNGVIDIELKEIIIEKKELPDKELLPGEYVRLSVSDNGIGMTPNTIQKIFEPYFTTKEKGKGTGLGLAVVYGIIKEHKGNVKVYSEVGKGTNFCIYLPLMKKVTEAVPTDQASEIETGTERILFVDDEVPVAKLVGMMLSRLGYQVTVITSSEDALNAFRSDPDSFDLVISDMKMPNLTGDQLAKEIFSIKPNIPIIICTGFSEWINKEQAELLGVKGFLMKPVVKSDMARMVRKVLDESKV